MELLFLFEEFRFDMLRFALICLAFVSGMAALSHELLWTRRLIDLLGATEWVTGRVLGLFFLGLSLGGWLACRLTHHGNSARRLAMAEFAIAILSLPALLLPLWADWIVAGMGAENLVSWYGRSLKLVLSIAVVLPPAIAMGTTMPLFIRVSTILGGTVKETGLWIYSVNMLGGVFGLWLTSTVLLDALGVQGTMLLAAVCNCVIAMGALMFAARTDGPANELADQPEHSISTSSKRWWKEESGILVLSFLSGLFVLALEVLVLRLLALVAPSSFHTTSALLANVILFLALGSIVVACLNRFGVSNQLQLTIGFGGGAIFCVLCPLVLYQITRQLVSIRYLVAIDGSSINSLNQYWLLLFGILAMVAGATLFFGGFVFPAILSMNSKADPEGKSVGKLLAINGLGGLLGCELANGILISKFGIYGGFVVLASTIGFVALLVCLLNRRSLSAIAVVTATLAVAIPVINGYGNLKYVSPRAKKKYAVKDVTFGREGVLMVVQDTDGSRSLLMNSQYVLGSSGHATIERRQVLLPWLLHPNAEKVCCLGLATGISAGGLETLNEPPEVTSVELSELVTRVAKKHFRDDSRAFYERSGNRIICEDGRTLIAATNNEYDIIVADLFRPYGIGEGRLFSVEHFRNVKRALKDDGMFCQWLPAHQLNEKQFRIIAASFLEVFPETMVVNGGILTKTPSIGLCAWKSGKTWETADLRAKIESFRSQKNIKDTLIHNAYWLLAGVLNADQYSDVPLNTLDNALLELDASRHWILKDLRTKKGERDASDSFISGENLRSFMRKLHQDTDPVLTPAYRQQFLQLLK